jgi:peptide deformylase
MRFAGGVNEERTVIAGQRPRINSKAVECTGLTPLCSTIKSPCMAVRDIVKLPDKKLPPDQQLRRKSEPVRHIDAEIVRLVGDMFDTMYKAPGIGLAAIQVDVAWRVITMDLSKKGNHQDRQVFINAEITWKSDEKVTNEEGCLSIPEQYEAIERAARVKAKYLDLDGREHEIEAGGLLATCLQHEIDHTKGVLFIDHLSRLKRDLFMKRYKKFIHTAKKPEA